MGSFRAHPHIYNIRSFYPRMRSAFPVIYVSFGSAGGRLCGSHPNTGTWLPGQFPWSGSICGHRKRDPSWSLFSSWMPFACREAPHMGVCVGLEPQAPCTARRRLTPRCCAHSPRAEGAGGLQLCTWNHSTQRLAPAPALFCPNGTSTRGTLSGKAGRAPPTLPAHKGKPGPAGGQERGWQQGRRTGTSPSPVITAHRSLWPQLNKPGCN